MEPRLGVIGETGLTLVVLLPASYLLVPKAARILKVRD